MKNMISVVGVGLAALALVFAAACQHSGSSDEPSQAQPAVQVAKVSLDVQGMTCSGCEYNVESAIKKVAGVTKVEADYAKHSAVVEYDPKQADVDQLVEAVNSLGYKAHKASTLDGSKSQDGS